jgi:hypothetical protein
MLTCRQRQLRKSGLAFVNVMPGQQRRHDVTWRQNPNNKPETRPRFGAAGDGARYWRALPVDLSGRGRQRGVRCEASRQGGGGDRNTRQGFFAESNAMPACVGMTASLFRHSCAGKKSFTTAKLVIALRDR